MKKKIESILDFIRKMEQNTFLLNDGFSDTTPLLSAEYEYRTYVGGRGDNARYIQIELSRLGIKEIEIKIRGKDILIEKKIDKTFSINDCYNIIELIFNEVHSFKNHDEGIRKIKNDIIKKRIVDPNKLNK